MFFFKPRVEIHTLLIGGGKDQIILFVCASTLCVREKEREREPLQSDNMMYFLQKNPFKGKDRGLSQREKGGHLHIIYLSTIYLSSIYQLICLHHYRLYHVESVSCLSSFIYHVYMYACICHLLSDIYHHPLCMYARITYIYNLSRRVATSLVAFIKRIWKLSWCLGLFGRQSRKMKGYNQDDF